MEEYYKTLGLKKDTSKKEVDIIFDKLSKELTVIKPENKKYFDKELDKIKIAYKAIIKEIEYQKNKDVRYIKCNKGHFYDDKLESCPECEPSTNINSKSSFEDDLNKTAFGTGKKDKSEKEIDGAYGNFGLEKTNPIPINGLVSMYEYLPNLRYINPSAKDEKNKYLPVSFLRTHDGDTTKIGSKMSEFSGVSASTSSPNIGEQIDVFNLYDINEKKIGKIYLHGYQKFTSTRAPIGFYLEKN